MESGSNNIFGIATRYWLQELPVELLVRVMKHLPDMAPLSRLFTAYPKTPETFIGASNDIFASIVNNMSPELRNSALDVLVTRSRSRIHPRHMTHFIKYCLDDKTYHGGLRLRNYSLSALLDLIERSGSIESLSQSFARDRILVPCQQQQSMQLSPVELRRIRRSLWRFQLCYHMCHPRKIETTSENPRQ